MNMATIGNNDEDSSASRGNMKYNIEIHNDGQDTAMDKGHGDDSMKFGENKDSERDERHDWRKENAESLTNLRTKPNEFEGNLSGKIFRDAIVNVASSTSSQSNMRLAPKASSNLNFATPSATWSERSNVSFLKPEDRRTQQLTGDYSWTSVLDGHKHSEYNIDNNDGVDWADSEDGGPELSFVAYRTDWLKRLEEMLINFFLIIFDSTLDGSKVLMEAFPTDAIQQIDKIFSLLLEADPKIYENLGHLIRLAEKWVVEWNSKTEKRKQALQFVRVYTIISKKSNWNSLPAEQRLQQLGSFIAGLNLIGKEETVFKNDFKKMPFSGIQQVLPPEYETVKMESPRVKPAAHFAHVIANVLSQKTCSDESVHPDVYADKLAQDSFKFNSNTETQKMIKDYTLTKYSDIIGRGEVFHNSEWRHKIKCKFPTLGTENDILSNLAERYLYQDRISQSNLKIKQLEHRDTIELDESEFYLRFGRPRNKFESEKRRHFLTDKFLEDENVKQLKTETELANQLLEIYPNKKKLNKIPRKLHFSDNEQNQTSSDQNVPRSAPKKPTSSSDLLIRNMLPTSKSDSDPQKLVAQPTVVCDQSAGQMNEKKKCGKFFSKCKAGKSFAHPDSVSLVENLSACDSVCCEPCSNDEKIIGKTRKTVSKNTDVCDHNKRKTYIRKTGKYNSKSILQVRDTHSVCVPTHKHAVFSDHATKHGGDYLQRSLSCEESKKNLKAAQPENNDHDKYITKWQNIALRNRLNKYNRRKTCRESYDRRASSIFENDKICGKHSLPPIHPTRDSWMKGKDFPTGTVARPDKSMAFRNDKKDETTVRKRFMKSKYESEYGYAPHEFDYGQDNSVVFASHELTCSTTPLWGQAVKILFATQSALKPFIPAPNDLMQFVSIKFDRWCWPDGSPIAVRYYPNGQVFTAGYDDGGGLVFYPHGGLAIIISKSRLCLRRCIHKVIAFNDPKERFHALQHSIVANLNSNGFGVAYHKDGNFWVQYNPFGGFTAEKSGVPSKKWLWRPGGQRYYFGLNKFLKLQLSDRDRIYLTMHGNKRGIRINLGLGKKINFMSISTSDEPLGACRGSVVVGSFQNGAFNWKEFIKPPSVSDRFNYEQGRFNTPVLVTVPERKEKLSKCDGNFYSAYTSASGIDGLNLKAICNASRRNSCDNGKNVIEACLNNSNQLQILNDNQSYIMITSI